jgi:hypothetical protein
MTKAEIAGAIGGIGLAGIATYLLIRKQPVTTPPSSSSGYTVDLIASSTSILVGTPEVFTVEVYQNGLPVNNALVSLEDITTGVESSTATVFGNATFSITVNTAGTYIFQAESEGVQSNTVSLVVESTVTCPCGYVYSDGNCVPMQPSTIQFQYNGNVTSFADVDMGFYVGLILIPATIYVFVDKVTIEYGKTGVACPQSPPTGPTETTLSGTFPLDVSAVDASDAPIGCQTFNLSLNTTTMSYTDDYGITWLLTFSVPSSVTANSSGIANATINWTLTRSWNGDNPISALSLPPTQTLPFGSLILTAGLPSSTLAGSIDLNISAVMCYYA